MSAADHLSARVEVVTLTRDDLERIVENATERGYRRAAEERERTMEALAERLETAVAAGGLKRWMTVREAGLYAGRGEDTIRRWIKEGLPASKGTRGYVIEREALDDWRARG